MEQMEKHRIFMSYAIEEAKKCASFDEVPVGAVIVRDGKLISCAGNGRESIPDATAHAEVTAIRLACKSLGGWNLNGCELYVTLEPCLMCAGAIVNARIERVIFGASDKKFGAFGGVTDIRNIPLNHNPEIINGIMETECADLLKNFFREKRTRGARWQKDKSIL